MRAVSRGARTLDGCAPGHHRGVASAVIIRGVQKCLFAADLGGTKLAVALVTNAGRIVARASEPVDGRSPGRVIDQIVRLAGELKARPPGAKIAAAGVAIPGLVRGNGTVWAPNLAGWSRVPLAQRLRARLRVPVAVESDRNAAVLGEAWKGAARGRSDVIVLLVGTGIGAGIVSGGAVLRGAHELSGCAGWMVVTDRDDPEFARCGCLEALAAGPGLARAASREMKVSGELTAADVAESARRGNRAASAVFAQMGRTLGAGVANLISLFDPEVIVLSGGMTGAADLYLDELKAAVVRYAQPLAAKQVKIVVSKLGSDANLLGVAKLAFQSTRKTKI
jgi:glucokinase